VARARLAAMAGNAALAGDRPAAALAAFDLAITDARAGAAPALAGELSADRARALVALDRSEEAAAALAIARRDAPQFAPGWLLSATLARWLGQLDEAQGLIEAAAALAPRDPAIGLEGGLIAALAGRDAAARQSWKSVLATAPESAEATTARTYLAQLDQPTAPPGDAR
jgi:tetratricopeptide (TPR) repeat protein